MAQPNSFQIVNIFDSLSDAPSMRVIQADIADFSSPKNEDVESFLRNSAINFCRLKQSITYLVYDTDAILKGYFTLAFKIIEVTLDEAASLSNNLLKQIKRFGKQNESSVQLPCVLLAQLSKNYNGGTLIDGNDLLKQAETMFLEIQRLVGGSFLVVECEEENTKLVARYKELGFTFIENRITESGTRLAQLIKKIERQT